MDTFTLIIANTVITAISAIQLLMMIRAILSWLPVNEDNPFIAFVFTVTEFVIFPVRSILERSEMIASLPLDLSFFVTFLLLSVLETVLTL